MQREVNRLLKRLNAEKLNGNHKECIEIYNTVGGIYSEISSFEEAIHYHEKALEICKKIGDPHATGLTFRCIGESEAPLGRFNRAIGHIMKYLELAKKTHNDVEIQRAETTLGRIYLMQAQSMKDESSIVDDEIKLIARKAEERFQQAVRLAEKVREKVGDKEFAQMKSALLVNIGLVKDILGQNIESVDNINTAIKLCQTAKLKEDLFRCQIILSSIYRQSGNINMAAKASNEALVTANQIGRKIHICDALIECGVVKIFQRDFKNAKRTFARAYLEKSPNEEDHSKAIRLTKLSHLISENYDKLNQNESAGLSTVELNEKLGDLLVAVGAYKLAADRYKSAFSTAKAQNSKSNNDLARLLHSVAQTYVESRLFGFALQCFEKELEYRKGNQSEECAALVNIARMHEYLRHQPEQVAKIYERALHKAGQEPVLRYRVLKSYVENVNKTDPNSLKTKELQKALSILKSYREVIKEMEKEDEEEIDELEDEVINVDDIITDDEDNEVLVVGRRRIKGSKKFKANEVGDTPLHEACINGDIKRVKALISQGHEVNPRDNAGWIPLHEACNHGHYEIAEYLIEHGADVNNRGLKGTSPLHDAATNGHFDIMRLLINNDANVIALTDTGETVLNCLRDYKKRNFCTMKDQQYSEYRQIEAELLSLMDKRGFSLINEVESTSKDSRPKTHVNVKPPFNDTVSDYKRAIGVLKKRPLPIADEAEKIDFPAHTITNISSSSDDDEDEIDDVPITKAFKKKRISSPNFTQDADSLTHISSDSDIEVIETTPPPKAGTISPQADSISSPMRLDSTSIRRRSDSKCESFSPEYSDINVSALTQPRVKRLIVHIEDRHLTVPTNMLTATIENLKEFISNTYSSLTGCKPNLSLAPMNDPNCLISDQHLCHDVFDGDVIATIDSWQLDPISESYVKNCQKHNLEPLNFIKAEIRGIGSKLDLSYTRFPAQHVEPLVVALARRNFTHVDLTCATSLFPDDNQAILDTILTWKKVRKLVLRCVRLDRAGFESICSKMKAPDLESLDVSFNVMAYKSTDELKEHYDKLYQSCPKLKRLDIMKKQ